MSENTPQPDDRHAPPHMLPRTLLLIVIIALLAPAVLDVPTHGAWSRFVLGLGTWRWVAWGACFAAMVALRFAGGPRRGA